MSEVPTSPAEHDPTRLLSADEINALAAEWAKQNGWSFGQALELVMWQETSKALFAGQRTTHEQSNRAASTKPGHKRTA